MKKKEFLTLVKNLKKDVKANIKAKRTELEKRRYKVLEEIRSRAYEIAKTKLEQGEIEFRKGELSVYVNYNGEPREVSLTLPFTFSDEKLEQLRTEYEELKTKLAKLAHLAWRHRVILDAWKLRAIENKTYNKEPFPEELIEFVSDDLKVLLEVGE